MTLYTRNVINVQNVINADNDISEMELTFQALTSAGSRRTSSTFSAIAYFSFSTPSPVTADIGYRSRPRLFANFFSFASLVLLATSHLEATRIIGFDSNFAPKLSS